MKATDTLVFGGYGAEPIASEKVVGGSDVITHTDHTTINVVGWDKTIFS